MRHLCLILVTLAVTQTPLNPDDFGEMWFLFCGLAEAALILACITVWSPASFIVGLLSGYSILWHALGWIEWQTGVSLGYGAAIHGNEAAQVLALVVMSPSLLRTIDRMQSRWTRG